MLSPFDKQKCLKSLRENGYFVFDQEVKDLQKMLNLFKDKCKDASYERGSVFKSHIGNLVNDKDFHLIKDLVIQEGFVDLFKYFGAYPQDVFITHEYKSNVISRNNYLHFDRLRALKVLVYLTDVDEASGPFSIVKNSHIQGAKFRRQFSDLKDYEEKKNRIDLDYPDIEYNLIPIFGKPGKTIIFDSDIFHLGGNVKNGSERVIIRSHWYQDFNWRLTS